MLVFRKIFRTHLMDDPKANPKKFEFMVLGRNISDCYVLNIDGMEFTSTDEVMLLGVSIDNKLRVILINYAEKHHIKFTPSAV